jgi:NADP-dependent 3-hydroxy acid dehydrogenase YdfG
VAAGHRVAATARPAQLAVLAERYGSDVLPVALDVTDAAAAERAVRAAVDTFGRLDAVVNNAGYASAAPPSRNRPSRCACRPAPARSP